ncbi:right-handed parallel beta-helix repeat-containing protein, partial [bacterium]|nr:right-handed parallel beta-helix repeat-containing protein [bacterium]
MLGNYLSFIGISCLDSSSPIITNKIITRNFYGIYCDSSSSPTISNNDIGNNPNGNYYNCSGTNDISVNPNFIGNGDYHLQSISPCIDKGSNITQGISATDKDGKPRIVNGIIDIGAYEYQGTSSNVTVYDVNGNFVGIYTTIQAGINACPVGGTVSVLSGIYTEAIYINKRIALVGVGTPIIDISEIGNTHAVIFDNTDGAVISGFKITGVTGMYQNLGLNYPYGGIYSQNGDITITNNTISGNKAGIISYSSSLTITNNTISMNNGDGIFCNFSSLTIKNNVISKNGGDGIFCFASSPIITNNIILNNGGHGIYCRSSTTIIYNPFYHKSTTSSNPTITNNTILYNDFGISCCNNDSSSPEVANNIVWSNATNYHNCSVGNYNISVNPQFIGEGDYHLQATSPCIDAGTNTALSIPSTDKDGNPRIVNNTVDIGAYEYQGKAFISKLFHNATNLLKAGEILQVTLVGEPDGTAKFDIGTFTTNLPMSQTSPGTYTGTYQILAGNNIKNATITGHLLIGTKTYSLDATPTITIDTNAPTFTTTITPDPAKTGTISIVITASEQLAQSPNLIIKDSANGTISTVLVANNNPIFTYSGTITTAQGTATVIVSGTDSVGNTGSNTTTFQIDTIAPTFTIQLPAYVKEGTFTVQITADEKLKGAPTLTIAAVGNNPIEFMLIKDANPIFEYQGTIATITAQGTATITIFGMDSANNEGSKTGTFIVDTNSPTFTVILTHDPASIGALTITVTPNELLSATPTLTIKDTANATITTTIVSFLNSTYTYQATITFDCADGTATIIANGIDLAENPGSTTKTFQISIPRKLEVATGTLQTATVTTTLTPFTVKLMDSLSRPIHGHMIEWEIVSAPATATVSSTITTTNLNGTTAVNFTLGTMSGTYTIIAKTDGLIATFTATAITDILHHINISPASPSITVNQPFPFIATGYDQHGNEITGLSYTWTTAGAIGTLTTSPAGTSATLQTPSTPGTGTISAATLTITGSTTVMVVFGELKSVTITPVTSTVEVLGTQSFTAQAFNQFNFPMGATYTWTLNPASIGLLNTTIGQTVVFTATKTGTVNLQVIAVFGTRTATATITITVVNGVVHRIDITPATAAIEARGTTSFAAKAFNQHGYELTEITRFNWQIEGTGTIIGNSGKQIVLQTNDVVGTLTLTASTSTVTGITTVAVTHGSVSVVSVNPAAADVQVMGSRTFTAS